MGDDFRARCKICGNKFLISHGGQDITRHAAVSMHRMNFTDGRSCDAKLHPYRDKVTAAECTIAYHTVQCDRKYRSADCDMKLRQACFPIQT